MDTEHGQEPQPQGVQVRADLGPVTWSIALATGTVAAIVTLFGAYDLWPFAGMSGAYTLGYAVSAVVHLGVGALFVGGVMDLSRPSDLLGPLGRTGMTVLTLLVVGAVVWLDVWLFSIVAPADQGTVYVLVAAVGSVVGGVLSYLILSTKRLTIGRRQTIAVQVAAAFGGLAAGCLAVLCGIALLGFGRARTLPEPALTVAPIRGITGGYVALGDSYSAGEGIRPFDPNTGSLDAREGDDCHRSNQAYSQWLQFADLPGTTGATQPSMQFVACSGAVSPDVYSAYEKDRTDTTSVPVAPQVDTQVHAEVGLVTMTMGGNDALFSRIVVHCLQHDQCMRREFRPPTDQASIDNEDVDVEAQAALHAQRIEFPPAQPLSSWGPAAIETISGRVATLYKKLDETYPNARIVVIGYPQLFPSGPATLIPNDCASLLRRFSSSERDDLRDLTTSFNDVLYEQTVAAGIEFVSPAAVWDGHEPCGSKGQYTNSIKLLVAPNIIDGGSFHPNPDGQKALAALVSCYLNTNPEPPNPFVDGTRRELTVAGLQTPGQLGLIDAPGSIPRPLSCDGIE